MTVRKALAHVGGRSRMRLASALGLATILGVILVPTNSGATVFGHATRLPVPTGSPKTGETQVSGLSCTSAGNCVAVGAYVPSRNSTTQTPVIVTETSGRWTSAIHAQLPGNAKSSIGGYLSSISCPTEGNCVAVGEYFTGETGRNFAVTESGGSWSQGIETPLPSNASSANYTFAILSSVSCTTTSSCVAVGEYPIGTSEAADIDTDAGGVWTANEATMPSDAATPGSSWLIGVGCSSAGNCQAVGHYENVHGTQLVAVSEAAGTWGVGVMVAQPSNATTGNGLDTALDTVACPSSTQCFAGGSYDTSQGGEGLFASESNGMWSKSQEARLPAGALTKHQGAGVESLACAASACVAGGEYFSSKDKLDTSGVTWDSAGRWSVGSPISLPPGADAPSSQEDSVNGSACPTATTCTIVGGYLDGYSLGSFSSTPATAPTAPTILKVTPTIGGLDVRVRVPVSNGGIPISTYQYSLDAGTTWKNRSPASNSTTIVLEHLAAHHTYVLAIRAVTPAGLGPKSNVVRATTT
jgi:hypothetical protein